MAETVAYDLALEVAMKIEHFQQRNLVLHGPWKWLLTEFASYFGVSDAYTKLRYRITVPLVTLMFKLIKSEFSAAVCTFCGSYA